MTSFWRTFLLELKTETKSMKLYLWIITLLLNANWWMRYMWNIHLYSCPQSLPQYRTNGGTGRMNESQRGHPQHLYFACTPHMLAPFTHPISELFFVMRQRHTLKDLPLKRGDRWAKEQEADRTARQRFLDGRKVGRDSFLANVSVFGLISRRHDEL